MSIRYKSQRSTEAPMDFQFTSRPSSNVKPVWAQSEADLITPRKRIFILCPCFHRYQCLRTRSHNDINPSPPAFPSTSHTPTFGTNQNVPFIFQTPQPQTQYKHPWAPPPHFSPSS